MASFLKLRYHTVRVAKPLKGLTVFYAELKAGIKKKKKKFIIFKSIFLSNFVVSKVSPVFK